MEIKLLKLKKLVLELINARSKNSIISSRYISAYTDLEEFYAQNFHLPDDLKKFCLEKNMVEKND